MSSSLAPAWNSAIFNTNAFNSGQFLTKSQADRYYLSIFSGRNLGLIDGITPGLVSSSKAVIVDSSNNISGFGNVGISGVLTMTNTNDSLIINNTSSTGRSNIKFLNDISSYTEFGLRGGSASSNPNTTYLYTNGSYKLIIDNPTGNVQILSTTTSTSYITGALTISGGVGIAGNVNINGSAYVTGSLNALSSASISTTLTVNGLSTFNNNMNFDTTYTRGISNVNYVNLCYSYLSNGIIACGSNNQIYIQSPQVSSVYCVASVNQYGLFINRSNLNPFGTCNANCLLDFGSEASPMTINLYGGSYGIGADNNQLQFMSGGSNGFAFYTGSSYNISTYLADINTNGSMTLNNKLRVKGSNSSGFNGSSLELGYNGTYGEIYSYNRSSLLFKGVYIGNEIYCDGNGHVSVGIGAVASSWKLEVGTNTQSVSSYGYLNSGGGVGFSGGSGSVSFSAYFQGRIAVQGEIDVLSDVRCKKQIRDITEDEAEKFIHKCMPKHYIFKEETNNEKQYGYIAQDIAKQGLDTLIICRETKDGLPELIDDDGFVSRANTEFTVSYQKIPALLHKYILMLEERIVSNEIAYTNEIQSISKRIEALENK
jgi:hypothetical protein